MNIASLLRELRARGISISLQGEQLKLAAPPNSLTPELRERLLEHKPALRDWLREQREADDAKLPLCQPDPDNLYQPFPLTDLQLGFSMADDPYMEFHVRPHYYTEYAAGDLDIERYEAAWDKALRRHHGEIVVVTPDGRLQTLRERAPLRCRVRDLGDATAEQAAQAKLETRAQMARAELPLDRWPWVDLRATVWREGGKRQVYLHYNHNNFFSDGYGTTRLRMEIERYYDQPDAELPPLTLSYRDAVLALDEIARSAIGRAAQRYWEDRLESLPEPPALPIRTTLDRRRRSRLERHEILLPAEVWAAFKARSAQFGVTPSNALFTAYAEVLSAWSDNRHFVLSNMMTRRLPIHPEIFEILGNFASLYPLEFDFRADDAFVERARRVQDQVMRDARRLQWGGMQVMQAWNRRRHADLGVAAIPYVVSSGLFMEDFRRGEFGCLETSQVLLDHQFSEEPDGRLYSVWDAQAEFFLPGVLDAMLAAYESLLTRLACEPEQWRAGRLLLAPQEQLAVRQVPGEPGATPPDGCLGELLGIAAGRHPRRVALRAGDAKLDYAGLAARAGRLAARLRAAMPDLRGRNVAIVAKRGPALVQAVHAVLRAGAAYVPVDPTLPEARRRYLIENSRAALALVQACWADAVPAGVCPVLAIEEEAGDAPPLLESACRPEDLAYVIYTSGSTGRPKGVAIEHRAALNTILDVNRRFGIGPDDTLLGVSSFGFDLSVYDLFGSAAAGAALIYPDPDHELNPSHWLDLMLEHGVTVWNSAPPLMLLLAESAEARGATLPALRLVMLSGDWIPIDLPARVKRIAPGARVVSLGGATEASIWSICYEIGELGADWQSIPYGFPMQGQPWHILDACGRPVPDWVAGELYIGGAGLARGYWDDPEKTAAAFVRHPISGERIYRTGDIGRYRPGGVIEFLGRRDSQVKIQGHRIELGEIEALLLAQPDIGAAVAAVRGSGSQAHLVAYVVGAAGTAPDLEGARQALTRSLPAYMVPRALRVLDRLPLSGNGKVDRKALPELDDAPPAGAERAPRVAREPRDDWEVRLLAIWRGVLNQPDFSVCDDFFDAGGQSFEAVRIVGAIRETFHRTLSLGAIWRERTVERVAALLRTDAAETPASNPVRIGGAEAGAALYLVHPAGGQVMSYRGLAGALVRPVFGFQAHSFEHAEPPASIEQWAAGYVAELERHAPGGPVLLGGWSSGALIAFEMAVQLRGKGRAVTGVAMIDCPAPMLHGTVSDRVLLRWFLEDLAQDLPAARLVDALAECPPDPARQIDALCAAAAGSAIALPLDATHLAAIYRVFAAVVRASRAYRPEPADLDLLLIRAERDIVGEFFEHPQAAAPDWGWRRLCRSIQTERQPGTHYTLLAGDGAGRAARTVESWLRGIDAQQA